MDRYRELYAASIRGRYFPVSRYEYPEIYGFGRSLGYSIPAVESLYPTYSRASLRTFPSYTYQSEYIPSARRNPPLDHVVALRSRAIRKRRPLRAHVGGIGKSVPKIFAPKKKPFKKIQGTATFQPSPKKASQNVFSFEKQQNGRRTQKPSAETLVRETKELHDLFRSGIGLAYGTKAAGKNTKQSKRINNIKGNSANTEKKKGNNEQQEKTRGWWNPWQGEGQLQTPQKENKKGKKKKKKKKKMLSSEKSVAITDSTFVAVMEEAMEGDKIVEIPEALAADSLPSTADEHKNMDYALEIQNTACSAVAEFLRASESIGISEPCPEAESTMGTAKILVDPEEEKELEERGYQFFSRMFRENTDLRKLYLERKDDGKFECLVCRSTDPATSRTFHNLTSLVLHTSMRNQNRLEHRGYGKAVCDLLGWEPVKPSKLSWLSR
ncbi:hypothetical protein KP509_28G052300 [Ceratopteris richardii]|uniref:Uncharacterized protein n=1 Tax=Ceratopteris richardii TaxID=49495 RepID=A0A8T2RC77_CERRI|nr:hypothetical protein KP509_28G052300 [Ceratopteris richardii]KAH7294010.1 hypothetical protein KP509_28G052300 [Ceratopteris richardii]